MRLLHLILACLAVAPAAAADAPKTYTLDNALAAIREVETGGCPDHGRGAKGDGGKALGPYQIWEPYWRDAAERDAIVAAGSHAACLRDLAYSRRVVIAYMDRYAAAATARLRAGKGTLADVERLARIHNGGPSGHRKKATRRYWQKVRARLGA